MEHEQQQHSSPPSQANDPTDGLNINEDYISSAISATIPEYNEKQIHNKTVTFYSVHIFNHFSKTSWTLDKRYREFETLYKDLSKILPLVPEIPKKTIFKVSSAEQLTKRRIALELFIKDCVKRKDVINSEPFILFAELEKHSPELIGNTPVVVGKIEKLPLGIRDFHYSRDENLLLMVCSDMNIISRADSRLTNIKLPWEKKNSKSQSVPLGAAMVFTVQKKDKKFEFTKTWVKAFEEETGVLHWDSDESLFSIGLDNGYIYIYKHQPNSQYAVFNEHRSYKLHKDRVMGLSYDQKEQCVFSCSTDKMFIWCKLGEREETHGEIAKGNFGFTNLHHDKVNARMFLTDEGGNIDVYSSSVFPPELVISVASVNKGCIRGLHFDMRKMLMFTCSMNGIIAVFDLGVPGKERMIQEISNFGDKAKYRIVRYDGDVNEVFTGDESGRISVWNLKNGKPICKSLFNVIIV